MKKKIQKKFKLTATASKVENFKTSTKRRFQVNLYNKSSFDVTDGTIVAQWRTSSQQEIWNVPQILQGDEVQYSFSPNPCTLIIAINGHDGQDSARWLGPAAVEGYESILIELNN